MSKTLLFSVEIEQLRTEINFRADRIRYGYNGSLWVLKDALKLFPVDYPQINELRLFEEEIEQEAEIKNKLSINALTSQKLVNFDICEHPYGIELWKLIVAPLFQPVKV